MKPPMFPQRSKQRILRHEQRKPAPRPHAMILQQRFRVAHRPLRISASRAPLGSRQVEHAVSRLEPQPLSHRGIHLLESPERLQRPRQIAVRRREAKLPPSRRGRGWHSSHATSGCRWPSACSCSPIAL